jgi:hypothetical protein
MAAQLAEAGAEAAAAGGGAPLLAWLAGLRREGWEVVDVAALDAAWHAWPRAVRSFSCPPFFFAAWRITNAMYGRIHTYTREYDVTARVARHAAFSDEDIEVRVGP